MDCLKKYTERRVEERRHTEVGDVSKLDTSRWMSLPRNLPRGQQASSGISGGNKRPSRDERQDNTDESLTTGVERWPAKPSSAVAASEDPRSSVVKIDAELVARPPGFRSHSTDVTGLRGHDRPNIEQRRHTDCSDPRTIATRLTAHIFHVRKREM